MVSLETLSRSKGMETWYTPSVWRTYHTLETLSRLKGMETLVWAVATFPSALWIFGDTFPVEGNRNALSVPTSKTLKLWRHFPAGRESKLFYAKDGQGSFEGILWRHFPVWREWKQWTSDRYLLLGSSTFGDTFPFEGNRNFIFLIS